MAHPYRIREIAQQAGLSTATVDRVLHGRAGVRAGTVAEVHRAIADLQRQASQVGLGGATFFVDLVVLAPDRFSRAVRAALEAELPTLRPAVVRARFHFRQDGSAADLADVLDGVGRRGSSGVLLKAPDDPAVVAAVARLEERGIPVVTFVTDVPASRRVAYVGMDDRAAGATAAYLLTAVAPGSGGVLVSLSRSTFRGEGDREQGFRAALRELAPGVPVHVVEGGDGLEDSTRASVAQVLAGEPGIDAVYSAGGGNRAVLAAFDDAGRVPRGFVAHDLDADNVVLLRERRLTAVLHHDLRADVRRVCRAVMQVQGALPGRPSSRPSQIQVITPYNEPAGLLDDH
ncbi:LacI family DNA-binding transcriptional regulator [Kineococcus rhizosphaerae]|uniref:LacI family transcriptional regulator n=1 Tax=Kineococcus rhizosphaerae TaxID=559628 RepID=A0A2T0R0F3_9ACTN|nr:LacI family DNA-binding transcriptional regulator [Kineococcus rhizosphaerae]PRY12611.1 LacI family transcriptional regulator [Kineococcus rhizosphaerae]